MILETMLFLAVMFVFIFIGGVVLQKWAKSKLPLSQTLNRILNEPKKRKANPSDSWFESGGGGDFGGGGD